LGTQPTDFDYTAPWPLNDGVEISHMVTSYNKQGRVLIRQSNPLPATILSITPHIEIGGDS
jgi:hypothetical protein